MLSFANGRLHENLVGQCRFMGQVAVAGGWYQGVEPPSSPWITLHLTEFSWSLPFAKLNSPRFYETNFMKSHNLKSSLQYRSKENIDLKFHVATTFEKRLRRLCFPGIKMVAQKRNGEVIDQQVPPSHLHNFCQQNHGNLALCGCPCILHW